MEFYSKGVACTMQMRQTYSSIEIKNRYNDRLIIFRNCGNLNTHVIRMNVMIHVSDIWNAKQILYSNFTSIIAFVKFLNLHQHPRIILISKKKKEKTILKWTKSVSPRIFDRDETDKITIPKNLSTSVSIKILWRKRRGRENREKNLCSQNLDLAAN